MRSKEAQPHLSPVQLKQLGVLQKMVENGGSSLGQAILDAGYSPAYAKNPKKLTSTKSFRKLVDLMIPPKAVLRAHASLLRAEEGIYYKGARVASEPNTVAIARGVDMAYRLHGYYRAASYSVERMDELKSLSDKELDNILRNL